MSEPNPIRPVVWRCSTCGLSYPDKGACQVCGEELDGIANDRVTVDLEHAIEIMKAKSAFREGEGDKVEAWRTLELIRAGADPEAARLVAESDADLHRALGMLRAGCSSVLLVEILT